MPRYIICLPHGNEHDMCIRAVQAIKRYGGHLFTHIEWGCNDGVHCGWLVVELDNREAVMQMVPPEFRQDAQVVQLNRFGKDDLEAWAKRSGDTES